MCKIGYAEGCWVDSQIVIGLLVDRDGFPLQIGWAAGNHAETRTIAPIVKQF